MSVKKAGIKKDFEELTRKLEKVNSEIESMVPQTLVRKASTFGNSSHIVLSKDLLDKEVGVIVFPDKVNLKGGSKK